MLLNELNNVDLRIRDIALTIVKYQKFKTKFIKEYVNVDINEKTLDNYISFGITYINTKRVHKSCNKKLYDYIDYYVNQHVQPLNPPFDKKRLLYPKTFTKKDAKLPIQKIVNKEPLTEKFEYGVRKDNLIQVFKSKNEAELFIQGVKFANGEAKLLKVTTEE